MRGICLSSCTRFIYIHTYLQCYLCWWVVWRQRNNFLSYPSGYIEWPSDCHKHLRRMKWNKKKKRREGEWEELGAADGDGDTLYLLNFSVGYTSTDSQNVRSPITTQLRGGTPLQRRVGECTDFWTWTTGGEEASSNDQRMKIEHDLTILMLRHPIASNPISIF